MIILAHITYNEGRLLQRNIRLTAATLCHMCCRDTWLHLSCAHMGNVGVKKKGKEAKPDKAEGNTTLISASE